jgi:hypothetical protein
MARIEIVERELFTFDELGDSAKEKARDWYRGCIESDEIADYYDWQSIAEILGIEFATRSVSLMNGKTRQEPAIYWSGFSSQGDGASFYGSYSYAKGAAKRIREYAPSDTELHAIADSLQSIQRPYFYRLCANITAGSRSNFYSHSGTMDMSVYVDSDSYRAVPEEDELRDTLRSFADWIYSRLESQWEYINSDSAVDELIMCNEYEFSSEGYVA